MLVLGVLLFLVRIGLIVFIGFNAPWFVTVLAVLLQVRIQRKGVDVKWEHASGVT